MDGKTYTLTVAQIVGIYKAGIERGNDEATSHEWGCSPSSKKFDHLGDELLYPSGHPPVIGCDDFDARQQALAEFMAEIQP